MYILFWDDNEHYSSMHETKVSARETAFAILHNTKELGLEHGAFRIVRIDPNDVDEVLMPEYFTDRFKDHPES